MGGIADEDLKAVARSIDILGFFEFDKVVLPCFEEVE